MASDKKFTSLEMVTYIFSSCLHPVAKVKVKKKVVGAEDIVTFKGFLQDKYISAKGYLNGNEM